MENKENNSPELKKKSHWNIRPYLAIALTAFLVITLSIIFFFLIYRYNGFAAGWRKLTVILQPIIIGIVIAYLINPIMMFFEKYLLRWIEPKIQKKDKAKKIMPKSCDIWRISGFHYDHCNFADTLNTTACREYSGLSGHIAG